MGLWVPQGGSLRGRNKGAYRGRLTCPVCNSEANKFLENVGKFRVRYRCRKCGLKYQYDTSNADPGLVPGTTHPYAAFRKNKFDRIVDYAKAANRENLKLQRRTK